LGWRVERHAGAEVQNIDGIDALVNRPSIGRIVDGAVGEHDHENGVAQPDSVDFRRPLRDGKRGTGN